MKIAVVKENFPSELRVALIPAHVAQLEKAGAEVLVEAGAGLGSGFPDQMYKDKGAKIVENRNEIFAADIVLQVRCLGANQERGREDLSRLSSDQTVIGMCDPLGAAESIATLAETGATVMALEMIPRITRAQSMDILSSMATIAGYRSVLLAAVKLPKIFPLMTTAAGTLKPARVFVIGVGVAGLQAIATAKRLGAVVSAYDVRPACREQVESVGGKFVELDLDAGQSEDKGGYAKAMGEEFYKRQRELMADVVAEQDVVVTTAAIPGRPSPLLVTKDAVERMQPGSVIIDLATERGGNCEVSAPDQVVEHNGVSILGPTNISAEVPNHASQMYSGNVTKFLMNMIKDGKLDLDVSDEIIADTLVAHQGEVVGSRVREILKLEPLAKPEEDEKPSTDEAAESSSDAEAKQSEDNDTDNENDNSSSDSSSSDSDKEQS
jgi:NAD(P) transhydrogenase subunit alpha